MKTKAITIKKTRNKIRVNISVDKELLDKAVVLGGYSNTSELLRELVIPIASALQTGDIHKINDTLAALSKLLAARIEMYHG